MIQFKFGQVLLLTINVSIVFLMINLGFCHTQEKENKCDLSFNSRYRSIVKDLWWRHFLSVLVSAIQMTGTILFAGVEAYDGFKHVPVVSKSLILVNRQNLMMST